MKITKTETLTQMIWNAQFRLFRIDEPDFKVARPEIHIQRGVSEPSIFISVENTEINEEFPELKSVNVYFITNTRFYIRPLYGEKHELNYTRLQFKWRDVNNDILKIRKVRELVYKKDPRIKVDRLDISIGREEARDKTKNTWIETDAAYLSIDNDLLNELELRED